LFFSSLSFISFPVLLFSRLPFPPLSLSLPADLFSTLASFETPVMTSLDVSYNNLTGGLPAGDPPVSLQVLFFSTLLFFFFVLSVCFLHLSLSLSLSLCSSFFSC
jgi:hypothetical protein